MNWNLSAIWRISYKKRTYWKWIMIRISLALSFRDEVFFSKTYSEFISCVKINLQDLNNLLWHAADMEVHHWTMIVELAVVRQRFWMELQSLQKHAVIALSMWVGMEFIILRLQTNMFLLKFSLENILIHLSQTKCLSFWSSGFKGQNIDIFIVVLFFSLGISEANVNWLGTKIVFLMPRSPKCYNCDSWFSIICISCILFINLH